MRMLVLLFGCLAALLGNYARVANAKPNTNGDRPEAYR
jgi:hypothetical protein